jgi:Na+/H+ antiporter NhaC
MEFFTNTIFEISIILSFSLSLIILLLTTIAYFRRDFQKNQTSNKSPEKMNTRKEHPITGSRILYYIIWFSSFIIMILLLFLAIYSYSDDSSQLSPWPIIIVCILLFYTLVITLNWLQPFSSRKPQRTMKKQ